MIVVIIAGGSGTRLWPLSTPDYPKHLLSLTGGETLLQNAYRRAGRVAKDVYVVTEGSHADHVHAQLPKMDKDHFVVEPARRGTACAIIAGLHKVQSRHDHRDALAFIHADHVIRDTEGFAYSLGVAGENSVKNQRLTLIGIEPTYPATGFGYIQKGQTIHDGGLIYKVDGFKEKPAYEVARDYMQSGRYLWNCGYFVAPISVFVRDFAKYSPEWKGYFDQLVKSKTAKTYHDAYLSFRNEAIDYVLMEPHDNLQVVPASFDWMDVGSFKDAHEAVESDESGNHLYGRVGVEEVGNSFIHNSETNKAVAVIGLDNVVVVNTPNGVLVARKDMAQKVKEVIQKLQD